MFRVSISLKTDIDAWSRAGDRPGSVPGTVYQHRLPVMALSLVLSSSCSSTTRSALITFERKKPISPDRVPPFSRGFFANKHAFHSVFLFFLSPCEAPTLLPSMFNHRRVFRSFPGRKRKEKRISSLEDMVHGR